MERRTFLGSAGATALLSAATPRVRVNVPVHDFDRYDFRAGPSITEVPQAKLPLPKRMDWKGLRLKAEIEVKSVRSPVGWACRQRLNDDGSLTLRPTAGLGQDDPTGGVPPA